MGAPPGEQTRRMRAEQTPLSYRVPGSDPGIRWLTRPVSPAAVVSNVVRSGGKPSYSRDSVPGGPRLSLARRIALGEAQSGEGAGNNRRVLDLPPDRQALLEVAARLVVFPLRLC